MLIDKWSNTPVTSISPNGYVFSVTDGTHVESVVLCTLERMLRELPPTEVVLEVGSSVLKRKGFNE